MNPSTKTTTKIDPLSLAVVCTANTADLNYKAKILAGRLQLPLIPEGEWGKYNALLVYTENGLQIQLKHDNKNSQGSTLFVNFLSPKLRYRIKNGGGIKQALARSVGIKPRIRPSIIDATAGLGKDSFILASLGCSVTMIERSPLLAALLEDGLNRAFLSGDIPAQITNRLSLIHENAPLVFQNLSGDEKPDTIYLDPMYPHSSKSALNKIEMRLIRHLVGDDNDASSLLQSALLYAGKRVVVKRPKGAAPLNGTQPSHIIKMKNSRYDIYMC